jgi:hypothetical protein
MSGMKTVDNKKQEHTNNYIEEAREHGTVNLVKATR